MAINTDSYFSNALGVPQTVMELDIFASSTTPKYTIGHRAELQDGRVFRYSHFGAAVIQGRLVSQDLSESSALLNIFTTVAPASAATTTDGTSGQKFVEITEPSITKDQFAGAYLISSAGTGRGFTYRIKGNSVTGLPDGPASGNLRMELNDSIQISLTADSDINAVGSKYANLEVSTGTTDMVAAGVAVANQAAADYGWVQTRGVVGCLEDGTLPIGSIVSVSDVIAGAVMQMGGYTASAGTDMATEPMVGYCVQPGADTTAEGTLASIVLTLE